VVCLYGVLETGESFLVRDHRQVPCFWVLDEHRDRVLREGHGLVERVIPAELAERVTLEGDPAARVELRKPPDAPLVRDRLHEHGLPTFEADVRFAVRYLIDRGIKGSLAIRVSGADPTPAPIPGPTSATTRGIDRVFEDPELEPADWTPRLSVLSLDIETDPAGRRVLSIALYGCGAAEVLMGLPEGEAAPAGVQGFHAEADLLAAFAHRVRELDPDVLTGWNVVDFDLRVLTAAAERWGGILELGRGPGAVRLSRGVRGGRRGPSTASVPGRLILDGIQLLRGAFVRMESYALDEVAREVLGEGKTLGADGGPEEILRLWREDRDALAEYNLTDARLALEILERLELVELAVARSRLTGLPPDRMGASIAAFDFLYLTELGKRGVVAPTVGSPDADAPPPRGTAGGAVLEPRPGLYENVLVLDFRSLYPSLIRTFGIDPLHYRPSSAARAAGASEDLPASAVIAPEGAAFLRERDGETGILPALLDELFPRREEARRRGDRVASYAVKILMNSFYGVLATPACRFYNPEISNAITGFGRSVLLWSRERIEEWGHRVLYGDTDSLFILSGLADAAEARALGGELTRRLNRALARWIGERWGVESRLEMELERLYLKLLLPATRGGGRGAAKRYAGLVEEDGERRTVFTGMEVVRRDWTELARRVQKRLYERLFSERPVEDYLRQVLGELRDGALDDLLVYHKGLRKDPSEYTSTTPPHVRAARKMAGPLPDVVAYVITVAGPEPADDVRHEIDHEHYVEKQLRPIAEPVLELLGKDFDALTGRGHQLGLF
jgi:DNA polymerase-2